MSEWDQMGIPVMSTSHFTHLRLVDEGSYAYITDTTSAAAYQESSCDLKIMREKLFIIFDGIGFQNNSAYTNPFSGMLVF